MPRPVAPPPPVCVVTSEVGGSRAQSGAGDQSVSAAQAVAAAGATPSATNSPTLNVTRKADGSLGVSGGANLTFAVTQSVNVVVNIEYN